MFLVRNSSARCSEYIVVGKQSVERGQIFLILSFICGVLQLHQFLFNAFLLAALGLPFSIRGGCNEQYCNDKYSLHKSFQSRVSTSCRIALPIKCELFPSQPQTTGNQFAPRIPCSRGRLVKSM